MRTATVEGGRRTEHQPIRPLDGAGAPSPQERQPAERQSVQRRPTKRRLADRMAWRNWRVRSRLVALILLPTAVAVTLGGLRAASSVERAADYQRMRDATDLLIRVGNFAHELRRERDLTVRYVTDRRRSPTLIALIRNQQSVVDAAAQQVRLAADTTSDAFGASGRVELAQLRDRLGQLPALRRTALDGGLVALPAMDTYSSLIDKTRHLHDAAVRGVVDEQISASLRAMASLVRMEEEVATQRALLAAALVDNRFEAVELDAFIAARAREMSARDTFVAEASATERQLFATTVTGQKVDRAESLRTQAMTLAREGRSLSRLSSGGDVQEIWFDVAGDTIDRMRNVRTTIAGGVITRAEDLQRSERTMAIVNASLTLMVLLMVVLITAMVSRSLVGPLRRLRGEALEIASHRLPELVNRLREEDSVARRTNVAPMGVASTDEIGEVARAFDEVHREAVRMAGNEAQLRNNINAMFVNLSRRTQTLVERQITLIDGLEQSEQDEQRLGDLFKLDHLATRMRRNSENLLVLAGQEPARRWSRSVEITDVVRAALSEVEGYERVAFDLPGQAAIAGQAVNDVIHLLAELIENALSFSAKDTQVLVSGSRMDDGGLMISVTDSGIGMAAEEIAQANHRLANPPVADVSVSRRMGLFVVGRLALRNNIRVQLRPHDGGGLTAMVMLPESLASQPDQAPDGNAFTRSWTAPPTPPDSGPPATATTPLGILDDLVPPGTRPRENGTAEPATGPLPAVPSVSPSPSDDYLPIFAAVESAWFRRTSESSDQSPWRQPAATDAGWQAAEAATQQPVSEGMTTSGLPKRVPKANLVPGSADTGAGDIGATVTTPAPPLSPDRARSRLSSFQQGVRQGRAVARGEISEDQGYPSKEEEQA